MKKYINFLKESSHCNPQNYGIYPTSLAYVDNTDVMMADLGSEDAIISYGDDLGFIGEQFEVNGKLCVEAPLTWQNGCILRKLFPYTAPIRALHADRSFGAGDRLGIATPGHLRALKKYDALPVLAQQSMRELNLIGRTYKDILDCASFAVFREGYKGGYGADGDHLKTAGEIHDALELGYRMITLDCCNEMHNEAEFLSDTQVEVAYEQDVDLEARYIGKNFDIGEGLCLTFDVSSLRRITLVYKDVIKHAENIYKTFFASGKYDADFEISIDETTTPTSPLEHFFVANELMRRGVIFETIAPRFVGEFQKGVDYIGDLVELQRQMHFHAVIARHFGYKLSLHSGSDKFSVFEMFGRETRGRFHVKTCGTSWLEAMAVIGEKAPRLYRKIHRFALASFDEARKYYHVTTDISKIPDIDNVSDDEILDLFNNRDARQLIHITYGPILSAKNENGGYLFRDELYNIWRANAETYNDRLDKHFSKHLELLYKGVNR